MNTITASMPATAAITPWRIDSAPSEGPTEVVSNVVIDAGILPVRSISDGESVADAAHGQYSGVDYDVGHDFGGALAGRRVDPPGRDGGGCGHARRNGVHAVLLSRRGHQC